MVKRKVNIICNSDDMERVDKILKGEELKNIKPNSPESVDMLKELFKKNDIDFVHEYNRPEVIFDRDIDKLKRYEKGSRYLVAVFSSVGDEGSGRIDEFLDEQIDKDLGLVYFIEYSEADSLVVRKVSERVKNKPFSIYEGHETGNYVFIQETVLI